MIGCVGGDALPVLMDGLARLEYRGYDSAGVALVGDDGVAVVRRAGALAELAAALTGSRVAGSAGIGHTRWATHGIPDERNAHPLVDCTGRLALAHNGIIENHDALRDRLEAAGHRFRSDTDTEVVVHLIESILASARCSLRDAVVQAVGHLEGTFGIVCIHRDDPGRLVAARRESPLVAGIAGTLGLVASDIPALLPYTRRVVPIEDRCVVEVTPSDVRVFTFDGREVEAEPVHVEWNPAEAERGGFDDFMLKEIYEQPRAVRDTVRGRVHAGRVVAAAVGLGADEAVRARKVVIVACGSSYHAGIVAKRAIEEMARIPVELDLASEFRYRRPLIDDGTLVIGVTQSGETADTLAAVRYARAAGAHTLAVTNVVGSSITRDANAVLFTRAGAEIGVAATKTFVTQLVALNMIALGLAQERGTMGAAEVAAAVAQMELLPERLSDVLALEDEVHRAAKRYADARDFIFIGRGPGYATALEGALKLKEISYIHAEGFAAGELKHGAIALVDGGVPVVAVLTDPDTHAKMLSNVQEVRARGAETILVTPAGDERARPLANELFEVPSTSALLSPVLDVVALQLLAYHVAKERRLSPDRPRNLAKSVTVE